MINDVRRWVEYREEDTKKMREENEKTSTPGKSEKLGHQRRKGIRYNGHLREEEEQETCYSRKFCRKNENYLGLEKYFWGRIGWKWQGGGKRRR